MNIITSSRDAVARRSDSTRGNFADLSIAVRAPCRQWGIRLTFATLCVGCSVLAAQDFDLRRHSIDNGGGHSAGGGFMLDGSIGQLDAGPIPAATGHDPNTSTDYQLNGGLWAVSASPTLSGPLFGDGFESP